jgi:uncharacterized protein DUF5655
MRWTSRRLTWPTLESLGPVHEDAVGVGVFLKRDRKLAEVRPRSRDVSLALYLPRAVHDPRIARVLGPGAPRVVHVLLLRAADEVDTQVRDWLTEAFLHASDAAPPPQVAPLDQ